MYVSVTISLFTAHKNDCVPEIVGSVVGNVHTYALMSPITKREKH